MLREFNNAIRLLFPLLLPIIAKNFSMKKYDVYGIGNAIVDIVTEVEHDFFERNNIEKGVMTLVDEKRQL